MTEKIFKMIKDNEVKFVDFRFTDPRGKWQHTAQTVESVDEDLLTKGIMFDGSSISGWKSINESDRTLFNSMIFSQYLLFFSIPQSSFIFLILNRISEFF